jgi:hypothetical protein
MNHIMHLLTFHLYCLAFRCWSSLWKLELFYWKCPCLYLCETALSVSTFIGQMRLPLPSSASKGYDFCCGLVGYDMQSGMSSVLWQKVPPSSVSWSRMFPETLVSPYQTLHCHNPKHHNVDLCCLEDLNLYSTIVITQLNLSVQGSSSQMCFLTL